MTDSIGALLTSVGLDAITAETGMPAIETMLRALAVQLNGADPLRRATIRQMVVERLKDAKVGAAANLIDAALGAGAGTKPDLLQGQAVAFADAEPWPNPVDGAELLERIRTFITRYLDLPAGGGDLLATFALYSHASSAFYAAPYIVAHSPAPQCGKTRLLEVLALLVRRPWLTIVPSTAVLFRVLQEHTPTLLLDEAEVVRGRGDAAQDVRALLQSGYRRGAFVPRCVGDANEVRNFAVFGPKCFALIGELPAALFDRCIRIEMQRRLRGRALARFRPRQVEAEALELRRMARRWAEDHGDQLAAVKVPPLSFLDERAEEVWEPLLAVGVVAGSDWYDRLHDAARQLSGGRSTTSASVELLADIREVFEARGVKRITSGDLASALGEMEGHRWPEWSRGRPITTTALARLLQPFGVAPTSDGTSRGYRRESFVVLWDQYLPEAATPEPDTFATPTTRQPDGLQTPGNPHGDWLPDGLTGQMQGELGPGLIDVDVPPGDPDTEDDGAVDRDEAARICPRGHHLWHRPGSPPHEGWVCCTCHPDAARALGWREGAAPPGRDSAGRRVLRRIR